MSALRRVVGGVVAEFVRIRGRGFPFRKVAGTLRVPLPSAVRQCLVSAYRSRWFVPFLALVALAAINTTYLWKFAPATARPGGRLTAGGQAQGGGILAPQQVTQARLPRLKFSTTKLDLGDGKPNEILRGELRLKNDGSENAAFSLVKQCSCTELSPLSGQLGPGESATIYVGLQLGGHVKSEKNTSIEIKSGEAIVGRCIVSAQCPAPFHVSPSFINFGSVPMADASQVSNTVTIGSSERRLSFDAKSILLEHASDVFVTELATVDPGMATVRVTLKPQPEPGEYYDTLRITSSTSAYPMDVALYARLAESITVVPRTVRIRKEAQQARRGADLLVLMGNSTVAPGHIRLTDGPPGTSIEDLGGAGRGRRRIRFSIDGDYSQWPREATIVLSADSLMRTFSFKVVKDF